MARTYASLAANLRAEPTPATLRNIMESLKDDTDPGLRSVLSIIEEEMDKDMKTDPDFVDTALFNLIDAFYNLDNTIDPPSYGESNRMATEYMTHVSGGRRSKISGKFDKCVKAVRRTVKARKGSTKESAAIAICTKSVLYPRKRTIKRYRKGRLTTQRRKAI